MQRRLHVLRWDRRDVLEEPERDRVGELGAEGNIDTEPRWLGAVRFLTEKPEGQR